MSCSDWKTVKLEEVVDILGDGLHGTPKYSDDGEYYFINGNNLDGKIIVNEKTKRVGLEQYLKYKKDLNDRTLLVSINGTLGKVAEYGGEDIILGKSACYFNVKKDVNKKYIKYILLSDIFKHYIHNYSTGTTIKNLGLKQMRKFKFPLPNIEEQEKIANILSSLDDKIELNNEMNKTLEEMAQSIFKRWFVDFEFPNEDGQPYKSSGGEMVESELGMIPKGWEVGSFSDISEILDSKRIPLSKREREKRANIYPYYGAASLMDYVDDYIFEGIHVLMGEDGTVIDKDGFPILQYVGGKFWVNNHAHVLKGKNEFSNEFVYLYLSNTNVTHLVTGAVQPKINQKNLTSLKLPIPDKNMTVKFNSLAKNIFEYIYEIRQENKKLEEIRSILLPVLMNGTINIK